MLEDPPSDMILKSTLISLGHLGALMSPEDDIISDDEMNFITKLPFVECGVPRALLSVIIESNKSSIKALSLRALATICTSSEAVEQLEEVYIYFSIAYVEINIFYIFNLLFNLGRWYGNFIRCSK